MERAGLKGKSTIVLFAGFALALALLGGVAWLNLRHAARAQESARWVAHTERVRDALSELLSALRNVEMIERGYVLTGGPTFLEPYDAALKVQEAKTRSLRTLTADNPEQQRAVDALALQITRLLDQNALVVQLRHEAGFAAAQAEVAGGKGMAAMNAVRESIERMDAVQFRLVEERAAIAQREANIAREITLAGSGLSVVLFIGVFALVLRENRWRQRSEAELERFFTLSLDMLCIASSDGYFKRISPAFTQTLGWSMEEILARSFLEFVHPDDRAATLREVERQVVAGENVLSFENRYRHKDGSWRMLSWKSVPQPGGFMYATARDVTEAKAAAEALRIAHEEWRAANAKLAQASKFKDEFLANMSHELRTPLNAILGLSEALLEQVSGPLTPRQVKSVTTISTSGQHLLALINDILDLSKIEAGKLELYAEPLNVDEFCQSCLVFVRTQAMRKKIGIAYEPGGRMAKFAADPKRFKQVLVNLLTNAVKFTPEGGRMGLTVTAPEGEDIVRFTVWDTGIGIAPENQRKLFRSFTQIDSGLSRAQEGSGLGLALVAKLVELHGGSVALESEPGQGSRFIVTLPLAAPPEPASNDVTDRRNYRRALIIEDDPTSGAILVCYLAELGVDSVLHERGKESVEAVLRERPDVILLDIQLPEESGWVVLTKLKEHPGTREIPVVVISVVDEPQKSRALGAAAHFIKPVTRAQLAGFLQRAAVTRLLPGPPCVTRSAPTGPSILLAEDNEANVQTIGGYLEDKGYAMNYATDGLVAVKLARELRPAVILMDIQMPVMDGLAAIREIRADVAMKDIPIVALTALVMPGDRERCLAAGATDYMSKPLNLKALAALIERLALPASVENENDLMI